MTARFLTFTLLGGLLVSCSPGEPATDAAPADESVDDPESEAVVVRDRDDDLGGVPFSWTDSPLMDAVVATDIAQVRGELDEGVDVDVRGPMGFRPLHLSCFRKDQAIVELLLERGASLEATDDMGATPLLQAVGDAAIVELLLARGADARHASDGVLTLHGESVPFVGFTALHMAAGRGHVRDMELLLAAGALVEARSMADHTPLHDAALNGHLDAVRTLLAAGARPDAVDDEGLTAEGLARDRGHTEVVELLAADG